MRDMNGVILLDLLVDDRFIDQVITFFNIAQRAHIPAKF